MEHVLVLSARRDRAELSVNLDNPNLMASNYNFGNQKTSQKGHIGPSKNMKLQWEALSFSKDFLGG